MTRTDRWLDDLARALEVAGELTARGRAAFDTDPALPLAFEALANRVGDLAKRLLADDPEAFSAEIWVLAARNRDFVVHHYARVDPDVLWNTVSHDFPELAAIVRAML